MGNPKGFLLHERTQPANRLVKERVSDWNEFHLPANDENLREQGSRCMDCGVSFCQSGIILAGMATGCPLHNLIPEWNDLVYRGLWQQASERLRITNNFPEFTGRVCPATCEGACTLGSKRAPVCIKEIELAIIEKAFENGWIKPSPPAIRTGKKVAVIGSGPAGLACADQLNQAGHTVVVFERADHPGGLLMYGIPNMKLDKKDVLRRRLDLMADEGIEFVTNTEVGKNYPTEAITHDFDAIVLCTGSTKPRDLLIEGRQLKGIHFAIDYLSASTKSLLTGEESQITAKGKDVVVVGGGDTGTDCTATALRQGCRSITQLEIMPEPPQKRASSNPWPEWPKVRKVDYGHEESIQLFGRDPREYCKSALAFIGDDTEHVKKVLVASVTWKEGGGRSVPVEIARSVETRKADLVLIAMGFTGPGSSLLDQFGVATDARSNIKADGRSYRTNVRGVFAAGDARRGQSLVAWAIHEGRGAARACDQYLMGSSDLP